MDNLYFNLPTQVRFIEPDRINLEEKSVVFLGGIAYKDEIICGECGMAIKIDILVNDFNELAKDNKWLQGFKPIENYVHWVDISGEILGETIDN